MPKVFFLIILMMILSTPALLPMRVFAQGAPAPEQSVPFAEDTPIEEFLPEEEPPPEAATGNEVEQIERELEKNLPEMPIVGPLVQPSTKSVAAPSADFKELNTETRYGDVAIIQKTYMPKTQRFQLFGAFTISPNDIFFDTFGVNARGNYFISEALGLELETFYLTSAKARASKDLENKQSVSTNNLVTPKSYYGVSVYFSSIYGKTAVLDRKIIPFEIYQTVGLGKMSTANAISADTIKLSIGELFSLSRNRSLRIDLGIYFYQSKTFQGTDQSTNSMFLTVGYQGLFPEVGRR